MAELPGITHRRWYERTWFLGVVQGVLGTATTVALSLRLWQDGHETWAALAGLAVAAIASIATVRGLRDRATELSKEPSSEPAELGVWTGTLQKKLMDIARDRGLFTLDLEVRVAIHKVLRERPHATPEAFQQITQYAGARKPGEFEKLGRCLPVRPGIIGLAMRYERFVAAERNTDDLYTFHDEMVLNWGYTYEEARHLKTDRLAWAAIPIIDPRDRRVIGVAYVDCNRRGLLQLAQVREIVSERTSELAELVGKKYDK